MKLGQMSPCFATKQGTHNAFGYAIFRGEGRPSDATLSIALPSLNDLCFGEFGVRVVRSVIVPILGNFISHIVSMSTKKEVGGVDAWRVVASMANHKVVRNGAVDQFVGDAVSQKHLTATVTDANFAVPGVMTGTLPLPTIVGATLLGVQPKAFRKGGKVTIVSIDKTEWFALYPAAIRAILCSYLGFLSTTTVAITVGNIVRGIIGEHKNLQFLCQAQDAANVAGHFLLVSTPVIIPQEGQL